MPIALEIGFALVVAPDFSSPTGATPRFLADWTDDRPIVLFRGNDMLRRHGEFLNLAERAGVVHWFANLCNFPLLISEARRMAGDVPQVATVHHIGSGEEEKVRSLFGVVDAVHAVSSEGAIAIQRIIPSIPIVRAPYIVGGWSKRQGRRPASPGRLTVGWSGSTESTADRKRLSVLAESLSRLVKDGLSVTLVAQGHTPAEFGLICKERAVNLRPSPWSSYHSRSGYLAQIDIYVSPSSTEGGPLPVFEAAARGVPVATTAVGLAAEFLLETSSPLALPVDDPIGQSEVLRDFALLSAHERALVGAEHRRAAAVVAGPSRVRDYEVIWNEIARGPVNFGRAHGTELLNRRTLRRDALMEMRDLATQRAWRATAESLPFVLSRRSLPRTDRL